jgi:hypothetical protein
MRPADLLPVIDIDDVHAGSDDIRKRRSGRVQGPIDVVEDLDGLGVGITDTDNLSVGSRRGRAGDVYPLAGANCPGVADDGLPRGSTRNELALHTAPWSGKDGRTLFGVGQIGPDARGDLVGRRRDVVVPVPQAQQNQLQPVRLDAVGVLGLIGMLHVRPFKDELLGEFSVTRNRFFTVRGISAAAGVTFEDCNLPGDERPAR